MRRISRTLVLVIPVLAALACGGRVGLGGDGGGGGGCPSPTAVASGAACTTAGETCSSNLTICGAPTAIQCTCSAGSWSCPPVTGQQCITPTCPGTDTVTPGTSCSLASQADCTVPFTYSGCNGIALTGTCTCQSNNAGAGVWGCSSTAPQPECPDAQPPGCPDPSFIGQGEACGASPQLTCSTGIPLYDCSGNFIGDQACQCFNGVWSCESTVDCPDAAACPDPTSIQQGETCFDNGLQCPGNPQVCDGAVFYDAFQCEGSTWIDVAVTGCATDGGGPVDAGGFGG